MTVSDNNELFRVVSEAVFSMDAEQLRNLAVGTYLELRESFYEVAAA